MQRFAVLFWHETGAARPDWLDRMTHAQSRGGLYQFQTWHSGPVSLAQGERAPGILAPAHHGPLSLVLDGNLYNRHTLAQQLQHPLTHDTPDADLILAAYERWGDDCLSRLVGEFSFVLWDSHQQRLLLARDAIGTRHLYYQAGPGWLAVATDLRALVALPVPKTLNQGRLLDALVQVHDRDNMDETVYQGMLRLPSAHRLVVQRGSANTLYPERHWFPEQRPPSPLKDPRDWADALREAMDQAVQARLDRHPSVATMLSGGLDSSSVTVLAARHQAAQGRSPLTTYTLSQEDQRPCPDTRAVRSLLQQVPHLDGRFVNSASVSPLAQRFDQLVADADEPFTLNDGIAYRLVYQAAAEAGFAAVMDGMAGDLLFFFPGDRVIEWNMAQRLAHLPHALAALRRHGLLKGAGLDLVRATLPAAFFNPAFRAAWRALRRSMPPTDTRRFFTAAALRAFEARRRAEQARQPVVSSSREAFAHRFLQGHISYAHERNNQMAAAAGISPISPLSDQRVVELMVSLPSQAKVAHGWYKLLLRQSMRGLMPKDIAWRTGYGEHPGQTCYPRFAAETLQHCADAGPGAITSLLAPWVNAAVLPTAWDMATQQHHEESLHNVFTLFAVGQWVGAHQPRASGSAT